MKGVSWRVEALRTIRPEAGNVSMATILNFKRAAPRTTRRLPVPKGGAAIVIFPGVRYERRDAGKGAPLHPNRERERRTKS